MNPEIEKTPEQRDIQYLQEQLEKIHVDPYRNVQKQTFTDSLQKACEVQPEFFEIALQESLAILGDAHTHVNETFRLEEMFPIKYLEINDSYYIIGGKGPQDSLLGKEVLKINNYPLQDILSKLSALSSKENHEVVVRDLASYLVSNKILRYYGFSNTERVVLTTDKGNFEITTDDDEANYLYSINPFKWSSEIINSDEYVGNSIYQFRMEDNNLIFQYNDCTNKGFSKDYLKNFKKELLEKTKDAQNIIVDFRYNDGGSSEIMSDVFEDFPNDKPIYVAMGRRTFSATIHHLLYLKLNKNAILVGENAGQKPNRFGDTEIITLPNSKIKIHSSFKYFELLPGQDIDVIEPDIKIPLTIEDYMNNTDPLNKWIKENL